MDEFKVLRNYLDNDNYNSGIIPFINKETTEIETQDNTEVNKSLDKRPCTNPNIVRSYDIKN